jgi:serine/threonine protein kinase
MTSPEDDRTVIRPAGAPPEAGAVPSDIPQTSFQRTQWAPGNEAASPPAMEKTQFVPPPGPAPSPQPKDDMGGNLPVGTRLGEFEITSLIGEGGFGIVYLAHDHSLQRRVALKEYMPSSLAARAGGSSVQVKSERHRETFEAGLKSFINEARLLASFDHPSLVKVYRFWEANGTAYMVMPFLEGTTLKDVLKTLGQRPDEAWLRAVLGPLTEALLVIHAEQCYHRDIAPDNVMLLPSVNRWLLLDFGAARRVIGDMTQALTVILKPGYAPVEQYAEIPGMKQGPWTDVYALAAVVYFAIIGKTPPPSVGRLLNDTYVPLVQAAAGRYSESFLAAVDKALAVRPEERTQSIGEFRRDMGLGEVVFDNYATQPLPPGTEIPVRRPPPPPAPPPEQPGRKPEPQDIAAPTVAAKGSSSKAGIAIGAVVVLGLVGGGIYMSMGSKPAPALAPAVVAAPAPAPAPASAPAPNFDAALQFAQIQQSQAPGYDVKLVTNKTSYRIGKDKLSFSVQSEREGYLYVFVYGADKVLVQLYPSATTVGLKVRKGQLLKLPLAGEPAIDTTDPAGPTELLALVSPTPRDHGALQPKKEGPILVFPGGDEANALLAKYTGSGPILAGRPQCPAAGTCDETYGAALVRVDIVP